MSHPTTDLAPVPEGPDDDPGPRWSAAPPDDRPAEVSTVFPAGQFLASVAQVVVATVETKLGRDPADVFALRRIVHEVATHLDRMASPGARVRVRVSAAPDDLRVELVGAVSVAAGDLDSWLVAEARARFDHVGIARRGARLQVVLHRRWMDVDHIGHAS